jgi:YVTN family beta-propeller protein
MGRLAAILALALAAPSCLPDPVPTPSSRGDRAEVQIYLQPLPEESRRLQLSLEDIAVVRADGSVESLALHLTEIKGGELAGKQTLLASGFLTPGSCEAILLSISKAELEREDGNAALLLPENPIRIVRSFDLRTSDALSLFLSLDPAGLVTGGFQFTPAFSLSLPSRELDSLTGYLLIPQADRISVFDRQTLQVVGSVATGKKPMGIAVNAEKGLAYIAASGDDSVEVLDILGGRIMERIPLRTGDGPTDLVLSENGEILLSANYGSDTISIVDPVQGVETQRISVGQGPASVTINRSGTRAYVTSSLAHTLSVIDLTAERLSSTFSMDETTPHSAALDRDEENLFVISRDSPNLTIFDPRTLEVKDKIYIGTGAVSIAVDTLSGLVLIARGTANEISIVDPFALMVIDTIQLEGSAGPMVVDHQENALMVFIPGRRVLQKVDLVGKRVVSEMDLDAIPSEVAVVENR